MFVLIQPEHLVMNFRKKIALYFFQQKGKGGSSTVTKTRPSKMEIYHRDNWIIIVHMATWKDLTKWNEENTIMDWINHMERIAKRVLPVPSCLQREGHASEKDKMVYYVLG